MNSRLQKLVVDGAIALSFLLFCYWLSPYWKQPVAAGKPKSNIVDTLAIVNGDTLFVSDEDTIIHSIGK